MRPTGGRIICACGWTGILRIGQSKAPCPACARPATDRMDALRIATLRAVRARPDAPLLPRLRIRLVEIGVLRAAGPRTPPNDDGRHRKPPRRPYALTDLGHAVLATADAVEAIERHPGAAP